MRKVRLGDAAKLLGVSVDTVRRWADDGRLPSRRTRGKQRLLDGAGLARLASSLGSQPGLPAGSPQSARNRFPGIVTRVVKDRVAAQVELQCGPHRVVSLMTREAADELGLAPGVVAFASVKATNVVVGIAAERAARG